jgi:hypothetical protein
MEDGAQESASDLQPVLWPLEPLQQLHHTSTALAIIPDTMVIITAPHPMPITAAITDRDTIAHGVRTTVTGNDKGPVSFGPFVVWFEDKVVTSLSHDERHRDF